MGERKLVTRSNVHEVGQMTIPYNPDDEARSELLAYLVVSQLVGHASTGEWLKLEHLIESENL